MATKEEELQKKREEAERKARRGEIDPTHEFTFQVHRICIFDRYLLTRLIKIVEFCLVTTSGLCIFYRS